MYLEKVIPTHEEVNVSEVSSKELTKKLTSGEWSMNIHDALKNADDSEIQLHNFEEYP